MNVVALLRHADVKNFLPWMRLSHRSSVCSTFCVRTTKAKCFRVQSRNVAGYAQHHEPSNTYESSTFPYEYRKPLDKQHSVQISKHNAPYKSGTKGRQPRATKAPLYESSTTRQSASSSRLVGNSQIPDLATIKQKYPSPTKDDYPDAHSHLFSNTEQYFSAIPELQTVYESNARRVARMKVRVPGVNQLVVLEAQGSDKIAARHAVSQYMLRHLHSKDLLKEIIPLGLRKISQDDLTQEEDATQDVMDYCARYDAIPKIDYQKLKSNRRFIFQVKVIFEHQNIVAIGRAQNEKSAEVAACLEFKRQAESWHTKHGDTSINVKDVFGLNIKNAKSFFEFYKLKNRGQRFDVVTEKAGIAYKGYTTLDNETLGVPVAARNKKSAELAGWLSGAVELKKQNPEMFTGFLQALKDGNGSIIQPAPPLWLRLQYNCVELMQQTIRKVRKISLPPKKALVDPKDGTGTGNVRQFLRRTSSAIEIENQNRYLAEALEAYGKDESIAKLRQQRQDLPMNQYTAQVLDLVNNNAVSIVVGATGSGKTTQVPQILLEQAIKEGKGGECNVICTQPRRIAATSVAQRVAVERNEKLQASVGYHVRFDARLPQPNGSITFCTTGILLQQLRHYSDETLQGITHILIDEVHERDMLIDFLLIILKRVLKDRAAAGKPLIRVVLMSATLDTELFAKYFASVGKHGEIIDCPAITVPGRTFPVKEHYLDEILSSIEATHGSAALRSLNTRDTQDFLGNEKSFAKENAQLLTKSRDGNEANEDEEISIDWKTKSVITKDGIVGVSTEREDSLVPIDLVVLTVAHIAKTTQDGAILVFLPGLAEIVAVNDALSKSHPLGVNFVDKDKYRVDILHSSLPQQQMGVFNQTQEGCRKIILSTNIAETSVTIADVRYVVDVGKLREKQYLQTSRLTRLLCTWVSKSNSKQRAGRAGRVQEGHYYALFSRARALSLKATGLPEMLRSDLQEICLDIRAQGFKEPIADFLAEAIEPPSRSVIESSLSQLRALTALDENENLTPLGKVLSTLPVDPSLGRMILLGVIFRCLDPMIVLGSLAGTRDLFVSPLERRNEANRARASFERDTMSDAMGALSAFREWRLMKLDHGIQAANAFTERNFLHRGALRTIEQTGEQIEEALVKAGLIPKCDHQRRFKGEIGPPESNIHSSSVSLIKALTLAGQYPNMAVQLHGRPLRTAKDNFVTIHPTSVNYAKKDNDYMAKIPSGTVITYGSKALSNDGTNTFLRETTACSVLTTMLFGGKPLLKGNKVVFDRWLSVGCDSDMTLKTVGEFRGLLDTILSLVFQDLATQSSRDQSFLADHPACATFAHGLVQVLDASAIVRRPPSTDGTGPAFRTLTGNLGNYTRRS